MLLLLLVVLELFVGLLAETSAEHFPFRHHEDPAQYPVVCFRGSGTEFSLSMTQSSIMHLQLDLSLSRKF